MNNKEFDSRKHMAFLCDCLSRDIKNAVYRGSKEQGINTFSVKHGWLIGYFVRQTEPIYPKDLEQIFHFPKSTLADTLAILEKDGLIEKVPVDGDGRKKQIVVTEKGLAFNHATEAQIVEVEEFIEDGISEEEMESAIRVLEKMQENARKYKSNIEIKKGGLEFGKETIARNKGI